MRKRHTIAYLAGALGAGLLPTLVLFLLSATSSWQGMASMRGLVNLGFVAIVLALAYLVPLAMLLRRLLFFRAVTMGIGGFVPAAALMAWSVIGALVHMPDGSVAPLSWADIALGSFFYGALGGAGGVMFYFVFRAIAGDDFQMPGATIDA